MLLGKVGFCASTTQLKIIIRLCLASKSHGPPLPSPLHLVKLPYAAEASLRLTRPMK